MTLKSNSVEDTSLRCKTQNLKTRTPTVHRVVVRKSDDPTVTSDDGVPEVTLGPLPSVSVWESSGQGDTSSLNGLRFESKMWKMEGLL